MIETYSKETLDDITTFENSVRKANNLAKVNPRTVWGTEKMELMKERAFNMYYGLTRERRDGQIIIRKDMIYTLNERLKEQGIKQWMG